MHTFLCPNCNYPNDIDLLHAHGSALCIACNTLFDVPLTLPDDADNPLGVVDNETADLGWPNPGSNSQLDSFQLDSFQFGEMPAADAELFNPPNSHVYSDVPAGSTVNWNEASAIARAKAVKAKTESSEKAPPFRKLTNMMVLIGLSACLLILLIGGTIYWLSNGAHLFASNNADGQGKPPRGPAKQVGKEVKLNEVLGIKDIPVMDLGPRFRETAKPLLYDEPLEGVQVEPYRVPMRTFSNLGDISFEEQKPLSPPMLEPIETVNEEVVEPEKVLAAPLPADPAPADRKYTIAPNLKFDLPILKGDPGNESAFEKTKADMAVDVYPPLEALAEFNPMSLPIMASQNGPFVALIPYLTESPVGWKYFKKQGVWVTREVVYRAKQPVPVLDLRSGKIVGQFDPRAPFWLSPILSPDGKTLVGPVSEPPRHDFFRNMSVREEKEVEAGRQSLYAWKRDSNEVPTPMLIDGEVKYMTFANDRALVLLVEGDQRRVEVWDTVSGKRARSIALESTFQYYETDRPEPIDYVKRPPGVPNVLAVSPGGKYGAVASSEGIQLLSLPEGKVLANLAPSTNARSLSAIDPELSDALHRTEWIFGYSNGNPTQCLGHQFLPSGDQLVISFRILDRDGKDLRPGTMMVSQWHYDLTKGQIVNHELFSTQAVRESFFDANNTLAAVNNGTCVTACDFKTRTTHNLINIKQLFRLQADGSLLALTGNGQINQVRAYTREEFVNGPPVNVNVNGNVRRERTLPKLKILKRSDSAPSSLGVVARRVSNPPAEFKSLPKIEPAPKFAAKSLRGWPIAWSNDNALLFDSEDDPLLPQQIIDLADGGFSLPPPVRKPLAPPKAFTRVVAGLALSNNYYATALDSQPGAVNLYDAKANRLLYSLNTQSKQTISWTDFDADDHLWMLENGILSRWKVNGTTATSLFALDGNYDWPIRYTPDRKILFVSSFGGTSIDAIDTANGECLARLRFAESQYATDIALSPDGNRLAVMYSNFDKQKRKDNFGKQELLAGVWNLSDGSLRTTGVTQWGKIAWVTPNHLLFMGSGMVHDLAKGLTVLNLKTSEQPLEVAPDGRLWKNKKTFPPHYRLSALSGTRDGAAREILDKDAILDFSNTPVQLVLKLGDQKFTQQCAGEILEGLQQKGWKIGPSNYTWYVTAKIENTDMVLTENGAERQKIPCVVYYWQLVERGKRAIIKTATATTFDPPRSKYYTGNTNTPLRLPSNSVKAIIDELLEKRTGIGDLKYDARMLFIYNERDPLPLPVEYDVSDSK